MAFYVYILMCNDGSYYTGHADNLESRMTQHNQGLMPACYTINRRPLELVFQQDFVTREEALQAEFQIKGWSRNKKRALIEGNWELLSQLSISYNRKIRVE